MKRVGACDGCKRPGIETAQCCCYVSIEWPDINQDNDYLRWLISHEGVSYEGNCVVFKSRCRWLTPEGDCSIYENRPGLCKQWPYEAANLDESPGCAYRFVEEAS